MNPETQLVTIGTGAVIPLPALPLDEVRKYIKASKSPNTVRGYTHDWKAFHGWCDLHGLCSIPASPETVALYVAGCAQTLKVGSLQRVLNAIAEAHKLANLEPPTHHPTVVNCVKGIRRVKGTAPAQKAPTLTDDIRAMIAVTDEGLIGLRDRALILIGFAGAFRRSELVGLTVEDCAFGRDGLTITLRRSKTDQEGVGRKIGIPYGSSPTTCPIRTLQDWRLAVVTTGPLFRAVNRHGQVQADGMTAQSVALVVKKLVTRAGLDPANYSGHSLRAGHVTSAILAGAPEHAIQRQTGHHSVAMLRRYYRDANLFRENSASKLGL